jgi:hypothetical protein
MPTYLLDAASYSDMRYDLRHMACVAHLFKRWLERQPARVRQVITAHPRDAGLDLMFKHGRLSVSGWMNDHGLTVVAEHDGDYWDFLLDLDVDVDVDPVSVDNGYRCRSCPAETPVWATIDELVIDHLLDPLSRWIEQTFLPAAGLAFFGGSGATWARLITGVEKAEGAVAVIWA